ncbi:hypothetical protein, partial [Pseudomonas syringae]|uniref:hypothetical protein n=1 Tax=Pseudomonas syringae TaxID=317 RepID=UPI001B80E2D2
MLKRMAEMQERTCSRKDPYSRRRFGVQSTAFANKFAPTKAPMLERTAKCRSELVRERARTAAEDSALKQRLREQV